MSWILISKGDATVSPKLRGHEGGGVGLRGFWGGGCEWGCDSHPSHVSHSITPCESHPPANRTPKGCGRTPPHFWDVVRDDMKMCDFDDASWSPLKRWRHLEINYSR